MRRALNMSVDAGTMMRTIMAGRGVRALSGYFRKMSGVWDVNYRWDDVTTSYEVLLGGLPASAPGRGGLPSEREC